MKNTSLINTLVFEVTKGTSEKLETYLNTMGFDYTKTAYQINMDVFYITGTNEDKTNINNFLNKIKS